MNKTYEKGKNRTKKVGSQMTEIGNLIFRLLMWKIKRRYIEMRETREKVEVEKMKRESLAAVHTHTHTHTQVVLMNK